MTSIIRKILRRAERAFRDETVTRELEQERIFVGETGEIDRAELLAELEAEDEGPSILLTVNTDGAVDDRGWFEDPVADFVEAEGLGTWLGGGQGSIDDQHFFDVAFSVEDVQVAIEKIRSFLDSRFPHVKVDITSSLDG